MIEPLFLLIHSPLVGTLTWQATAQQLRALGYTALTPELRDDAQAGRPFWQQEVDSIEAPDDPVWLVGHSAAGALLPLLGQKLRVRGMIFVDAVLPTESASRMEWFRAEHPGFAAEFEASMRSGGKFPNWQAEQLRASIPDGALVAHLLADVRPRGLDFFSERIDVPADWDKQPSAVPCAYVQLSETYEGYAATAERRGWITVRQPSHHFAMLTQPAQMAGLLVELTEQLRDQNQGP